MTRKRHTPLAELAERQHGVVTREQLRALGLSDAAIDARVHSGLLRPIFRGVYAVGHAALRPEGRWLAGVLACGGDTWLSHRSAACLFGRDVPGDGAVHVTTTGSAKSRPGLVVHRTRRITKADVTHERGIPVTTIPRTFVDLADVLTFAELRAVADRGARLDERALRAAIARNPGRPGARRLRLLLGDGDLRTRSWFERRVRRLCRAHGLPEPVVNGSVLGFEVDLHWPEHRLIVEADGHAYHADRLARRRDHRRDAALQTAGWAVLRILPEDVELAGDDVALRLRRALSSRGARPTARTGRRSRS